MDVTMLRRNLEPYAAQAKLVGIELNKAITARSLGTGKAKIKNTIMGVLNTDIAESAVDVEKLKRNSAMTPNQKFQ